MTPLRIIFAGSPAAAVPSLAALIDGPHRVVAALTRPDAPQGRKRVLTPTPVAVAAEQAGVPVLKASRPAAVAERIGELAPDLGVIVAYGALLREPVLTAPRLGWINLHFSLLPRWRGAAPVQHALLAGDRTTGVTVFQLVEELDAGDVHAVAPYRIGAAQTAGHLLDALAAEGARVLHAAVDAIAQGTSRPAPQSGEVTLAPKLTLADGRLPLSEPLEAVYNRFRGVTPEPGAHTEVGGARLKVIDAAPALDAPMLAPGRLDTAGARLLVGTATSPLELVTVQPAGGRRMSGADWWRGRPAGSEVIAR